MVSSSKTGLGGVSTRQVLLSIWFFLFMVNLNGFISKTEGYTFTVSRLFSYPIMNTSLSVFDYNYNAAYLPLDNYTKHALLVRCQNNNSAETNNPWTVTPSVLSVTQFEEPQFNLSFISNSSVVFEPSNVNETYGTEDPRIAYRNSTGVYYLLYSAVEAQNGVAVNVRLSLATATDPLSLSGWTRHGAIFPDVNGTQWTKSGAMLIRDPEPEYPVEGPHLLFWGDSSFVPGLQYATSPDLLTWQNQPGVWLPLRNDSYFDSALVEAGPYPMRLSDGNYLFLYNSARHGYPSVKPDWDLQYNVGWAILNGANPIEILDRSLVPIFSPELDWEVNGLTPNVVFVEGWQQVEEDTFLFYYGAADTNIGVALLKVQV